MTSSSNKQKPNKVLHCLPLDLHIYRAFMERNPYEMYHLSEKHFASSWLKWSIEHQILEYLGTTIVTRIVQTTINLSKMSFSPHYTLDTTSSVLNCYLETCHPLKNINK